MSIWILILAATIFISYKGFTDYNFKYNNLFSIDGIKIKKDYHRWVTGAFLHADWNHLIFNMISFFFFAPLIESKLEATGLLLIYFLSLLGGHGLAYYINRNNLRYSALGASGAVSGIIFATIALQSDLVLYLFFFIPLPAWLFALLFVGYSIYGSQANRDNIGHEAHLGGAITGMLVALFLSPTSFSQNKVAILLTIIPSVLFLLISVYKPDLLNKKFENPFKKNVSNMKVYTADDKFNTDKQNKMAEIDRILDKIGKHGMDSLSSSEKKTLEKYN